MNVQGFNSIIGHDFLQKGGFKPSSYTFFLYGLNAFGFASCIYTVLVYDVATGLNSIGIGANNIQLVAKILLMRYAELMVSVINRIVDVYEANANTKSPKRAIFLHNMSRLSEMIFIGGFTVYISCATLLLTIPIYGYFWQHELKPMLPLYIPFVDENTAFGFTILISIQTVEIYIAAAASGTADFPFMMMVINMWVFSTIFHDDVIELNEILRESKVNMPLVKAKLRSIFEMYCDVWVLIDDTNTISFLCNFIAILCAAVAAAAELFTCMAIGLIPAVLLTLVFLIQIVAYCAFGTIIELCNDQMTSSLSQCDWYLLPISEQMKFKFLVMHANMGKTLTLGGIRPLSMDTCVTIMRKIYSYVMVLRQIIE